MKSLTAEQSADAALGVLSHFRVQFYDCLYTRADALLELTDAVLCADGPVTSLVELTLTAEHRRGHGAMYDAVNHGWLEPRRLRRLLATTPLPRAADGRIVLAVDVSNWLRPDAPTSPGLLFCHVCALTDLSQAERRRLLAAQSLQLAELVVHPVAVCLVEGAALAVAHVPASLWRDSCHPRRRRARRDHHTDRGSEYCSLRFKRACRKLGVAAHGQSRILLRQRLSEAFNSVLKVEYVHRHTFATRNEARIEITTWITDFYNARRLQSVCGFKSQIDYERDYRATLAEGLAAWIVSTLRGD
ncbi:hypothetical protein GCM10010358_77450 [Streptomyces minutiscleroticus]|uniref:Transposase IS701-like DDE domain-containing protein n=1 Tax=Streptomyces minutiscleroticus TaxID=68238 RepID=A0A918P1H4_9ACTN|nr:hypothetical protein GCM10010358_77450 [Streptomyces minutiscleroticus]